MRHSILIFISGTLLMTSCNQKLTESASKQSEVNGNAIAVVNNYLKIIGGVQKLNSIKNIEIQYTLTLSGYGIDATTYKTSEGKYRYTTGAEYEPYFAQIFNLNKAYEKDPDGTITYYEQGEKYEQLLMLGKIFRQCEYATNNYLIEFAEELNETINGEVCKVIKVTNEKGRVFYEYYSEDTGLLLKETTQMKNGLDMDVTAHFFYSDYQMIENIAFPFTTLVSGLGHAKYTLTVKSIELNQELDNSIFKIE